MSHHRNDDHRASRPETPTPMQEPGPEWKDWQIERIKAGLAAARAGEVLCAEVVFARVAAKYGWTP